MARADELIRSGVAVISGASGGLGRAMAIEMTRRGVRVCGFGRRLSALQETAALATGAQFVPKVVDVSDADAVAAAFAQVRSEMGPVSILVNNAAVYPHVDVLRDTPSGFMQTVAINLGGVVSCTHAALQDMVETGVGRIVNVGSYADIAPLPCSAAYSVSKGAVRILTRALVADLGDRFPDIVISTWMPGVLATEMGLPDGIDPAVAASWGASLALWHERGLNGVVFQMDQEMLEPRSFKRRIKDKVLMRKVPPPRRLATQPG